MRPTSLCLAVLALASLPLANAGTGLNVKTGLWSVTTTTATQGMMIPAGALAQMPPAQRAKIEAAMQASNAKGARSHTIKTCVTAKDLQDGAFTADEDKDNKECVYKMTSVSATKQEGTMICSGDEKRVGKVKFEALSPEHVKGEISIVAGNGKVDVQLESQWIAASCGNVK